MIQSFQDYIRTCPPCFPPSKRPLRRSAAGGSSIVVDAEDRENEGDFICAAEKVTPEIVNFMITHGRGQLCMPILPEVSQRLELPLMVGENTAPLGTNYTVPVDHRSMKTGITAAERATTIRAICDPTSKPADFTRPGPRVSAGGQGRRRAAPRRTHRSGRRPGAAGRSASRPACCAKSWTKTGDRANRERAVRAGRRASICRSFRSSS